MKKIFVVDAPNAKISKELAAYILLNKEDNILVPNVVFMSIYYDTDEYLRKSLIENEEHRISIIRLIFKKLLTKYKNKYIDYLLEKIDDRDTPRTTLFIFCQNRILFHYIRKHYGYSNVKSISVETNQPYINYEDTDKNKFKSHDIRLVVVDWKDKQLRRRIITHFVNKHIPVKMLKTE